MSPALTGGFLTFVPLEKSPQKCLAFLYSNNERAEREIKETIPFTISTKRIKYLRINLRKEAKDL